MLGGCLYQREEVVGVVSRPPAYLYAGYDLRSHAAHEMALYPLSVVRLPAIPAVEPADEAAGGKARRVYGEIHFYRFQGTAAQGHEGLQGFRKLGVRYVSG